MGQRRIPRRLAELLAGCLAVLSSEDTFEGHSLLRPEGLEVPVLRVLLEACQGLRDGVHGSFAMPLRLFQEGEVAPLDSLVIRVVCCHGLPPLGWSHCLRRVQGSRLCAVSPAASRCERRLESNLVWLQKPSGTWVHHTLGMPPPDFQRKESRGGIPPIQRRRVAEPCSACSRAPRGRRACGFGCAGLRGRPPGSCLR